MNTGNHKSSIIPPESQWDRLDPTQIEFDVTLYDLFSGIQDIIRQKVDRLTTYLGRPGLSGPLNTILYELASNGLKAIYKKAFYKYVLEEIGLSDVPYEEWLKIFNAEITTNKALNFVNVCKENGISVRILCRIDEHFVRFEITNDGAASELERDRLAILIKKAKTMESFSEVMLDDEDSTESGSGFGIPLIIITLRGLGISLDHFHIILKNDSTVARLDFPLSVFRGVQSDQISLLSDKETMQNNLWDLFHNLNYSQIVFNEKGTIESISSSILSQMEIPEDKVGLFPSLLKLRFYEDLFSGPFGVKVLSHFENYRIILNTYHTKRSLLFNVSGIFSDNPGKVITLWQLVNVENTSPDDLSEGSIFENIHIQKIVAPYISDLILDKAIQSIKRGQKTLPNEIKDLTIMFLDLIGFTHQSENMDPHEVINLLNTVMGVTVHCIETNQGMIDKFLGDGIMSIFTDPLSAVVAAIEIQNNLYQLNAFRSAAELPSINARIGINSGSVILGSVGTKRRMDWTALGDVVNTASRIEKQSRKHSVLVSSNTYERIKNQVHIQGELIVNVKGKDKDLNLVFVNSVTFQRKGESITLTLSDESPELPVTSPEFPHKQSHKGSVTIQ